MFNRRLKVFIVLLLVLGAVIAARLMQLQVVRGNLYRKLADEALERLPRHIPAVRGRIFDRYGRLLASDEPSWDVCMDYGALDGDETYIRRQADRWRRRGRLPTYAGLSKDEQKRRDQEMMAKKIEDSFGLVAELTGRPLDQILQRREYVLRRVAAILRDLLKKRGSLVLPGEMRMAHPIVEALDDQTAVRAKLALVDLDWLCVRASTRRIYHDATAVGHIIGRLGQVTAETVESDPFQDDELRRYLPWETFGVAGVERLCEPILRGWRGAIQVDIDGEEIGRTEPKDGMDAILTLDGSLQEQVYDMLARTVKKYRWTTGGAAAILHIPTREVLALVSYPSFDPALFRKNYTELIADTRHRPTLFRAVAGVYPPGSVVKAATLATGLALNVITPETRLDCKGFLHSPTGRFKCWIYNKFHLTHNGQGFPNGLNAEEALMVSCNCYFYQLGERIKGDRLCQWFRQFWVGPPGTSDMVTGTGLIEEREGILPTAAWLWEHQRRPMRVGDSRNFAIGQGEVGLTPIQVANLMATVASGKFQWPSLVANDGRERPVWDLGIRPEHWQTVRNGLYRVVNQPKQGGRPGGTAYTYAHMDEIALAGKTGSAQCSRIVLSRRYVVQWPDGRREKIVAKHREEVERQIRDTPGAKIISSRPYRLWPPKRNAKGKPISCAHAWFAGYVPGGPGATPQFAIAVLVEFGESGGRKAAPVAKEIIHALIESPHHYLETGKPRPSS